MRVWVVISALTQVTNHLTQSIAEAISDTNHLHSYLHIFEQHVALAVETELITQDEATRRIANERRLSGAVATRKEKDDVDNDSDDNDNGSDDDGDDDGDDGDAENEKSVGLMPLWAEFQHLRRVLEGIRLTQEASPRLKARVLAFGELLSTQIGLVIMRKCFGVRHPVTRVDARHVLVSDPHLSKSDVDRYLEAQVRPHKGDADGADVAALSAGAQVQYPRPRHHFHDVKISRMNLVIKDDNEIHS